MFMKSWFRVFEEAGETGDTGAGAATDAVQGEGAEGQAQEPAKDMLSAIDSALGYQKGEAKPDATTEDDSAKAKPDAEEDPEAAKAKAEAEEKAKADEKPKDLKSLELTTDEKKAVSVRTQQRFNEVLGIAKTERAGREAAEQREAVLAQSRDAILGVLRETNTSDQDLAQLLEFNRLTKTQRPEDLEAALQIVSAQRLHLLKALGREGDGHDPLKEHADLLSDVEDQKITRERALELVAARRRAMIQQASERRGHQEQSQTRQAQEVQESALAKIDSWSAQMAAGDLDFKAKEAILLPKIQQIVREYPPNLWLTTIKTAYEMIAVPKSAPATSGPKPLRPSGAKPGGAAPATMEEAINQGLGYGKP